MSVVAKLGNIKVIISCDLLEMKEIEKRPSSWRRRIGGFYGQIFNLNQSFPRESEGGGSNGRVSQPLVE